MGEAVMTTRRQADGAIIVDVRGTLDAATVDALRTALMGTLQQERPPVLVVDLTFVTFMDSLGIGTLVAGYNAAREVGTRFVLRNPSEFLFPSLYTNQRPISDGTLNVALRRLGYGKDDMTSHGFRATASTLLNESGLWHPDAIERALAHGEKDRVRAAYHRGTHWAERVRMAQWWSDHLDQLRVGGKVLKVKFRRRA